jgi:hypothetical protein
MGSSAYTAELPAFFLIGDGARGIYGRSGRGDSVETL